MAKDPRGPQMDTEPSDLQPLSPGLPPSDFTSLDAPGYSPSASRSDGLLSSSYSRSSRGGQPQQTSGDKLEEQRSYARRATDTTAYQDLEITVRHMRKQVKLIMDSLPSMSVDEHAEHHEDYALHLKERKEKEEEDKKLKKELKSKLIKTVAQAVFMALVVVLSLGLQAQFSKWVNQAVEEKAAASAATKRGTVVGEGDKK